jgi:cytochrome P450
MTVSAAPATPRGGDVPGPRGHPVLGNTLGFKNDIIGTLMAGFRDYGDIVKFRGVGPLFPIYLFAHPDYAMHALKDNAENYPRTPLVRSKWHMVVGDGLICIEGDFWKQQRKLAQPSFDPALLQSFDGLIGDETELMLEDWESHAERGESFDVARDMVHLALANLGGAMFSTDWRQEALVMADAVEFTIGYAYMLLTQPVVPPENVPTPANRRFKEARRTLEAIMERMIAGRRGVDEQPKDLLGTLLSARDAETGEGLSEYQVRSHLMTFMFGGHETVAVGLAWTWWLLSKHPEVLRKLEAEIDEKLNGARPTFENTRQLEYLTRVINESLRIRPPVWLMSRMPTNDDEVGGYRIPAGSQILISSYVSHHHTDFWPNPEGFDPDRWLPDRVAERPKHVWFPFSGGPHQCIGGYFGLMEMQIVIAMILQRYELELVPGHRVEAKPGITLGFKHGLQMTLRPRKHGRKAGEAERKLATETAGAPAAS